MIVQSSDVGVMPEGAKSSGEGFKLGVSQRLFREVKHLITVPKGAKLLYKVSTQIGAKLNPSHLGSKVIGMRGNG